MTRIVCVAVVVMTALATGCGSGNNEQTSSAREWADSVCSSVVTWRDSLTATADDLKTGTISKATLQDAADSAQSATDTLASDLKDAGAPDVPSKEKAKKTIDELADTLKADAAKISDAVDSATGVSGTLSAVSSASGTFAAMGDAVTSAVDDLRTLDPKGELEDAVNASDACKKLR
jgi:hypothetical protein